MEVKARGIPPYRITSGFVENTQEEHWENAATFTMALNQFFSLTEAGQKPPSNVRVIDSKGDAVLSDNSAEDMALLRNIDTAGLIKIKVIE